MDYNVNPETLILNEIKTADAAIDEIRRVAEWLGYADTSEMTKRESASFVKIAARLNEIFGEYAVRIGL